MEQYDTRGTRKRKKLSKKQIGEEMGVSLMKLVRIKAYGFNEYRWRYAVACGVGENKFSTWFPAPEIFSSKEEAIREAPECYPNRKLIIDDIIEDIDEEVDT